MTLNAAQLIDLLGLQPLPGEGGWYAETYRSAEGIPGAALPERFEGRDRLFGTAIYYLLTAESDSFSALHRLRGEEIYHFYLGDPVEMLLLFADGTSQNVRLGHDLAAGERVQFVVPPGSGRDRAWRRAGDTRCWERRWRQGSILGILNWG
jgi:predicted cupin superfamily sugar epimerase